MQEAININLKYNILEKKRIASFNKNPVYLSKLKKIFMRVKELEYDLLPKIYFLLNNASPQPQQSWTFCK